MIDQRVLGTGVTAVFTAKMRALEAERTDPVVADRYAQMFVAASGLDYGSVQLSDLTGQRLFESNVVRTWWLDQQVETAVSAGCEQLVILGSGLDSRAFRLTMPDVTVFELERTELAEFKKDALAQVAAEPTAGKWTQVPVALEDGQWSTSLVSAGFVPDKQTCWISEGLFYLPAETTALLLREAAALSGAGSVLAVSHFGIGSLREAQTQEMDENAQSRSGRGFESVVEDPQAWASSIGWTVSSAQTIGSVGATLGRSIQYSEPERSGNEYTWLINASLPGVR